MDTTRRTRGSGVNMAALGGVVVAVATVLYVRSKLESLRKRTAQLNALSNVFAQITEDLSLDGVASATLRETQRFMQADMVTLRRMVGDKLVSAGSLTSDGRIVQVSSEVRVGEGPTGKVAETGRSLRIGKDAELSLAPRSTTGLASPSEQLMMPRFESGIIAPLMVGSELVGTLACWSHRRDAFTEEDEHTLEMLASQAATAMMAAVTMAETNRKAYLDTLTELPNRLQLKHDLQSDFSGRIPDGSASVFAMVEIDDLKSLNDEFGFTAGDYALREVAHIFVEGSDAPDFVYRFGGGLFLLVYAETSHEEARERLERVQSRVGESVEPLGYVSVSIGLAPSYLEGVTPAESIERADAALYQAKRAGRNRVSDWGDQATAA